jgi:hypothetical protein
MHALKRLLADVAHAEERKLNVNAMLEDVERSLCDPPVNDARAPKRSERGAC